MVDLESALHLCRQGHYHEALDAFSTLIEQSQNRLPALGHRAWLYRTLGRYEDALGDYQQLLTLTPEDLTAAGLHAQTLMLAGQYEKAAREAVYILNRDPYHRLAAQVLVGCQQILGAGDTSSAPAGPLDFSIHPVNPVLQWLEQDQSVFPTPASHDVGLMLYCLVRCHQPALALETGTFAGYSTICLAQALKENGRGHLHAFDVFPEKPDYRSPVIGPCADMLEAARAHLERAGLARFVTLHKGDSSAMIRQEFDPAHTRVDFALIDGDHTIKGCLKDWEAVDERLAEGGLVLVHDTEPERSEWLGPRSLLEELGRRAGSDYHWLNLPTVHGCGLGVIQKRTSNRSPRWKPSLTDLLIQRLYHQCLDLKSRRTPK